MELELKHFAPYLPYGLKWKFDGEDFTHDIVGLDITNRGVKLVSPYNDYGDCEISSGKPLLLPMSSLYTEMEDGKVPIVELFLLTCRNKSEFTKDEIIHQSLNDGQAIIAHYKKRELLGFELNTRSFFGAHEGKPCSVANQLYLFTYLFENHFDVFGLIDKGLALDKTKIK